MVAGGRFQKTFNMFKYLPSFALRGIERNIFIRQIIQSRLFSSKGSHYLVVGLGNYTMPETRHSVGMIVVNKLANKLDIKWQHHRIYTGYYGVTQLHQLQVILFRPKQLMNINGGSVLKIASAYNIQPSNILLIHDDLDKPLGKYSFKEGGSARTRVFMADDPARGRLTIGCEACLKNCNDYFYRGHNGVKSVMAHFKSCDFKRLLVGIGRPANRSQVITYVLQNFTNEEKDLMNGVVEESCRAVYEHLRIFASSGKNT